MLDDQPLARKYTVRVVVIAFAFVVLFAATYILDARQDPEAEIWILDVLATLSFCASGSLIFASLVAILSLPTLEKQFNLALKTCILAGMFFAVSAGIWSASPSETKGAVEVLIIAALAFLLATGVALAFILLAARLARLILPRSKS